MNNLDCHDDPAEGELGSGQNVTSRAQATTTATMTHLLTLTLEDIIKILINALCGDCEVNKVE